MLFNTTSTYGKKDYELFQVVKSYYPDYDVITAARSLLNEHITYIPTHIAGHQDDILIGPLDFQSTLIVGMDGKCKEFRGTTTADLSMAIVPNQKFTLKFQDL